MGPAIIKPEEFKVSKKLMRGHRKAMEWVSISKGAAHFFRYRNALHSQA